MNINKCIIHEDDIGTKLDTIQSMKAALPKNESKVLLVEIRGKNFYATLEETIVLRDESDCVILSGINSIHEAIVFLRTNYEKGIYLKVDLDLLSNPIIKDISVGDLELNAGVMEHLKHEYAAFKWDELILWEVTPGWYQFYFTGDPEECHLEMCKVSSDKRVERSL